MRSPSRSPYQKRYSRGEPDRGRDGAMTVLDVRAPARRTAVDQLGQPRFGRSPELPETLALEVQAAARAPHGVEHRGAMLGQQARGGRAPRVANDQARLREDLDAILIEVQRRRLANGRRRHRVLVPGVADARAGAHDDRVLQRVGAGGEGQRTQPTLLLGEAHGRDDAGGAIRPLGVDHPQPVAELPLEVGAVVKAAAREEALLDPADEIFDGALLLARPRPAQLGREAVVERDLPEHRVPDDQLALARQDDSFGIVPDRHERHAPEGLQGMEQPADQRLLPLVGDERDVDEATPLEAAGKEADALHDAGDVPHAHQAEVVLAEFAGDALKADERGDGYRAEPPDQLVQRALAAPVAVVLAQASDDLAAGHGPLVVQPPLDRQGPGRGQRRATHAAGADQPRGVAAPHDGFVLDPPDAAHRHACLRGDRRLGHSDCAQDLDLMPGPGSDHSSPFPGKRLAAASPGSSVTSEPVWTGQNFRKGSGQNFRNPQVRAPIYANPTYPYGSQSPPNPIIGYLEVGSKPHVRRMEFVEPWPYWEVRLESGARGYLFAPDVKVSRR